MNYCVNQQQQQLQKLGANKMNITHISILFEGGQFLLIGMLGVL